MYPARVSAPFRFILLLSCVLPTGVGATPWTVSADQRNGLPVVSIGGATAMSSTFVFWRKDWAWAGLSTEFKVLAPFEYAIVSKNRDSISI